MKHVDPFLKRFVVLAVLTMLAGWHTTSIAFAKGEDSEDEEAAEPVQVTGTFLTSSAAMRLPSLNRELLRFAYQNHNRKLGNGQCTALVTEGLKKYGGKRFPPYGRDADYVWGNYVGLYEPGKRLVGIVQPGDILQFRNAQFAWKTSKGRSITRTARHHTAVVSQVYDNGNTLLVFHQNVGSKTTPRAQKEKVHHDRYQFTGLKSGWVKVYRPVAATSNPSTTGTKPKPAAGSKIVWVRYTIRNDSGRTVGFSMQPSGKRYTMKPGTSQKFQSQKVDGKLPTLKVDATGRTYTLSDGLFQFGYDRGRGGIIFMNRSLQPNKKGAF